MSMDKDDIITKLIDLHGQATKERSHYYVASVVREAMVEITSLRMRVAALAKDGQP